MFSYIGGPVLRCLKRTGAAFLFTANTKEKRDEHRTTE